MSTAAVTPVRWLLVLSALAVLLVVAGGLFVALGSSALPEGPARSAAPGFTLPDLGGRSVEFSAYAAGRPAVVSFGTTSCPYCRLQLDAFKELHRRAGDQVAILEVYVGEPAERVAAHVAQTGNPFPVLLDARGSVYSRYGTGAVPVTVVFDKTGRSVEVGGYIRVERLLQLLGFEAKEV